MFDTLFKRRGRGAQSNRSGRFETLHRMDVVDGWHPAQQVISTGVDRLDGDASDGSDAYGESSSSISTLDNELSHRLEPRAAASHRRLRTVKSLADAGIPVRISVSPIIPALNEHEIDAIVEAAAEAGATGANAIVLRLPHELSELFPEWLDVHYPLKKERVLKAIRSLRDGKLNDSDFKSRFAGQGPRADIIRQRFEAACRRYGLATGRTVFNTDTTRFRHPLPPAVQPFRGQQIPLF